MPESVTGPGTSAQALDRPYADVAVEVPVAARSRSGSHTQHSRAATFTYSVPARLSDRLAVGRLVWVPFGRRTIQGVVVALRRVSPVERTRDISALVEDKPALSPERIALARWMSDHYMAPLFACLKTMLPPGSLSKSETVYRRTGQAVSFGLLTDEQQAALGLFTGTSELSEKTIASRSGSKDISRALEELLEAGILEKRTQIVGPRVRPKRRRWARLLVESSSEADELLRAMRPNKAADALVMLREIEQQPAPCDSTEAASGEPDEAASEAPCPETNVVAHARSPRSASAEDVQDAVGCSKSAIARLAREGLVAVNPGERLVRATVTSDEARRSVTDDLSAAPAQAELITYLADLGEPVPPVTALEATQRSDSVLRALAERGLVEFFEIPGTITPLVKGGKARQAEIRLRGVQRQAAALAFLEAAGGAAAVSEVVAATGISSGALAQMAEAGLVALTDAEVWRDPLAGLPDDRQPPPTLTSDQLEAWGAIEDLLHRSQQNPGSGLSGAAHSGPGVVLLHGVTGSGKTELYLRAIENVIRAGRQAIVLVPEIALTAQTIGRFARRVTGNLGLWHSRLSEGERFDTWRRCRDGELDVIVGSRSALFAPLANVGLIVLDEEHADSYKQPSTPRYHARDAAARLGRLSGALVVLGSATPSMESFWQARNGRYTLLQLPRRLSTAPGGSPAPGADPPPWGELPDVLVVDMRDELRSGNRSIFSRELVSALTDTLESGEQAILFINRRGSNTFVLCRDCGSAVQCPSCHLPLTYHGVHNDLVCHHCNHREPPPMLCAACGSSRIRYFGAGTQRVEETTLEQFPEARTIRWDADTTSRKGSHEAILAQFASGEADILIGTQMVAKGLDLPRVTLVGVVSADTSLNFPDFRSAERTFQLLTQVAGRAGRSSLGGRVVVQTYSPEIPAITYASRHDYTGFYHTEINFRDQNAYPPFRRLARLVYHGSGGDAGARRAAERLAERLRERIERLGLVDIELVGPAPAFYSRVRGRSRWHIIVKAPEPRDLLFGFEAGPGWRADIDPVDLL